jgi:hypothetical protein
MSGLQARVQMHSWMTDSSKDSHKNSRNPCGSLTGVLTLGDANIFIPC